MDEWLQTADGKLPPIVDADKTGAAAAKSTVPIRSRFGLRVSMGVRARYEAVLSPADQQRIKSGRRRRTVSGHEDHFLWDQSRGHLFKKAAPLEIEAYEYLSQQDVQDPLMSLVSPYGGVVMIDSAKYLTLADLLHDFDQPSVMDIKLGSRTFLESASSELRADLYAKLKKLNVDHLITDEEKKAEKCTKIRYLHLRDCISSSVAEGFRIEGILHGNHVVDEINFKTLSERDKIVEAIKCFLVPQKKVEAEVEQTKALAGVGEEGEEGEELEAEEDGERDPASGSADVKGGVSKDAEAAGKSLCDEQAGEGATTVETKQRAAADSDSADSDSADGTCRAFVAKLAHIKDVLMKSNFFRTHQFVGTSLLFAKDANGQVGVWVIDFGKTSECTKAIDHQTPWEMGNEEDGYLVGLDNLRDCFTSCLAEGRGAADAEDGEEGVEIKGENGA
jgi:hypothetical protein